MIRDGELEMTLRMYFFRLLYKIPCLYQNMNERLSRVRRSLKSFFNFYLFIPLLTRETRLLQTTPVDPTSSRAQTSTASRNRGYVTATMTAATEVTRKIANRSPVARRSSPVQRITALRYDGDATVTSIVQTEPMKSDAR